MEAVRVVIPTPSDRGSHCTALFDKSKVHENSTLHEKKALKNYKLLTIFPRTMCRRGECGRSPIFDIVLLVNSILYNRLLGRERHKSDKDLIHTVSAPGTATVCTQLNHKHIFRRRSQNRSIELRMHIVYPGTYIMYF